MSIESGARGYPQVSPPWLPGNRCDLSGTPNKRMASRRLPSRKKSQAMTSRARRWRSLSNLAEYRTAGAVATRQRADVAWRWQWSLADGPGGLLPHPATINASEHAPAPVSAGTDLLCSAIAVQSRQSGAKGGSK